MERDAALSCCKRLQRQLCYALLEVLVVATFQPLITAAVVSLYLLHWSDQLAGAGAADAFEGSTIEGSLFG